MCIRDRIIIVRDGKIKRVNITKLWSTADDIIFKEDLLPGDLLAITRIPYAPEGSSVEIIHDEVPASDTSSQ